MTNEVRQAEMMKMHAPVIKALVKGSAAEKQFKGWAIELKADAKELIALNGGKTRIEAKGLLECWVLLKRLLKKQPVVAETKKTVKSK